MQHKEKSLKYYIHKLTHLRRDYKKGGAPHKPILILSLIDNIEQGLISENSIFITPELVSSFKSNWSTYVITDHTMLFTLPFYHMSGESFWNLIPNQGCEKWVMSKSSMRSFSNLNTAVKYAEIDIELFNLLKQKEEREILKVAVLDKYFPSIKQKTSSGDITNYIQSIEYEIVEKPSVIYRTKLKRLQAEMNNDSFEEEKFIRNSIFKRQISKLYNNTCAISGLRIDAVLNVSMIDACHIIPFSTSYDDTITNGISLNPTLHRAFDRGLISIDDNYTILISGKFTENIESNYSIQQFENKEIILPNNSKFHPNLENLKWHRDNIFKR